MKKVTMTITLEDGNASLGDLYATVDLLNPVNCSIEIDTIEKVEAKSTTTSKATKKPPSGPRNRPIMSHEMLTIGRRVTKSTAGMYEFEIQEWVLAQPSGEVSRRSADEFVQTNFPRLMAPGTIVSGMLHKSKTLRTVESIT